MKFFEENCSVKDMNTVAQIKPYLFLGNASARTKSFLDGNGITFVVNAANTENYKKCPVNQIILPLQDSESCDIKKYFESITTKIFEEKKNGGKIYVHCVGGISRSTTLVLAYLMRYDNMSLQKAHELVKSKRTFIRPNLGFWKQLVKYEKELHGSNSVTIIKVQGEKEIASVYQHEYEKMVVL